MKIKTYLLLALFTVSATNVRAADSFADQNSANQIKALQSLPEKERAEFLSKTVQNLHEIQVALLEQLTSTDVTVKCYAAYLLGEYRFPQAASSLAQQITLHEDLVRRNDSEWFWDSYPAMEALIKIGTPSIRFVVQNLAERDDVNVRDLSLQVLYGVAEKNKDIVQSQLQKALAAEKNSQNQARLQLALKALENLH